MNLTNLDFSTMPDAILAAAMMLNYRQQPQQQQPGGGGGESIAGGTLPGTILRSSQKSSTAPRKSALNMKEQLLISAGIISGGGGGSGSGSVCAPNVNTLGRTGGAVGVDISTSGSPNLTSCSNIVTSQSGGICTSIAQHFPPGTSLISGGVGVGDIICSSSSTCTPPCAANVIQFELQENNGSSGSSNNISGKSVPRPPKRHTPTVKFSPDTFANITTTGGGGGGGGGGVGGCIGNNPSSDSSSSLASGNVTLSSVIAGSGGGGGSTNVVMSHATTNSISNTNPTAINQLPPAGGPTPTTLKSSLKKNSSYSTTAPSGTTNPSQDQELKV